MPRRLSVVGCAEDGMTRITGLLDPVTGHTVRLALDAASPRPAAEDTRTRGQRQADALHDLAAATLTEAKTPGHARPHVLITMDAETFRAAREHLEAGSHTAQALQDGLGDAGETGAPTTVSGDGTTSDGLEDPTTRGYGADAGKPIGPAPVVRCQDGPLLPLSELGRMLCDSQIARLVLGAESEPLDLVREPRPDDPDGRRSAYRTVPRARTRTSREEGMRARLLADARARRPDGTRIHATNPDGTRIHATNPDGSRIHATSLDGARLGATDRAGLQAGSDPPRSDYQAPGTW